MPVITAGHNQDHTLRESCPPARLPRWHALPGPLRSILPRHKRCKQAHSENEDRCEKNSKDEPVARTILPAGFRHQDQCGEQEQHEGKSTMESADFRSEPRIETLLDLPALIGVRAVRLAVAGVADVRGRLIEDDPPRMIRILAFEVLPGGTSPRVPLRMVGKSGYVELLRHAMRLPRHQFRITATATRRMAYAAIIKTSGCMP